MKKVYSVLVVCFTFLSLVVSAEESTLSLQQRAALETAQPSNITTSATQTNQNSSGVIQLTEELNPNLLKKSFWTTTIKFQQMSHSGKALIGGASPYSFSDFGSTTKPSLSVGLLSDVNSYTNFNVRYGFSFDAGFTAQDKSMLTSTGMKVDGRLQYYDFSARPVLNFPWKSVSFLSTQVFGEIGQAQLAMASRTSSARFSKNSMFYGYGMALDIALNKTWAAEIEYAERRPTNLDLDWSLASSNTQLGVQYKW